MDMTILVACVILFGAPILWVLGGVGMRITGLLIFFTGSADTAVNPDLSAVLLIGLGAFIWLVGHWHYAVRHLEYKSPLARYFFCRWAPKLDPTAGWASQVIDGDRRRNHGR